MFVGSDGCEVKPAQSVDGVQSRNSQLAALGDVDRLRWIVEILLHPPQNGRDRPKPGHKQELAPIG